MQALPSSFAVSLQRKELVCEAPDVMKSQQKEQQRKALRQFTKLAWVADPAVAMEKLMEREEAVAAFSEFLSLEYMEGQLQLWQEARLLSSKSLGSQQSAAVQLFRDHIEPAGTAMAPGAAVVQQVQHEATRAGELLAVDSFPRFLQSVHVEKVLDMPEE